MSHTIELINCKMTISEVWKQGDIITNGDDFFRILGVCGEVVFISASCDSVEKAKVTFAASCALYTQKELERRGWYLYTESPKEETIDLLGKTYKKEEIEKALKEVKPIN